MRTPRCVGQSGRRMHACDLSVAGHHVTVTLWGIREATILMAVFRGMIVAGDTVREQNEQGGGKSVPGRPNHLNFHPTASLFFTTTSPSLDFAGLCSSRYVVVACLVAKQRDTNRQLSHRLRILASEILTSEVRV